MINLMQFNVNKPISSIRPNNSIAQPAFKGGLTSDVFVKSANTVSFSGKQVDKAINYYDKNADAYFETTKSVDMETQYKRFLNRLNPGDKILDAGCGSGRDSKNFIDKGFEVTAIDGSPKLAKKASSLIGQEVFPLKFKELEFKNEFDGVWACASLVHLPKAELEENLRPLIDSLKDGGTLYTCMKLGSGEADDAKGRPFSYYSWDELEAIIEKQPDLEIIDMFSSDDKLKRKDTGWVNILAKKVSQ